MPKTIIHKNNIPYFGDEELLEVALKRKFSDMIFELLSEKKPNESESRLFETILNMSIDHGEETPSAIPTIEAAKSGKTVSESVAAGMIQINERHGGAVEGCMEILYKIKKENSNIKDFVQKTIDTGEKLPGFGHRFYETDPRTELLFELMKEENLSDEFIKIAKELEEELEKQKGKKLPINVDGAIAVVMCTLGWEPKVANTIFLIARTPGLVGQFLNHL